jgi:hypothetical protein
LAEIRALETALKDCLDQKKDFESIHKSILNLCRIIYSTKKEYKTIDIEYPNPVILIFKMSDGSKKDLNEVPRKEEVWRSKLTLAENALKVLSELKDLYTMRKKLEE